MGIFLSALPGWFLVVLFATLGVIWGSFVGALSSRWPKGESIASGRSRCENCSKVVAACDLVPVASYLMLRGKCRSCGHAIGVESLAIEMIAGTIGAVAVATLPPTQALATAVFGWLLLPLAILDYRHYWLPDRLVLVLAATGLLAGPLLTPNLSWGDRAIGAASGFFILEAVRLIYRRYRQREGMGAGDPKLFGAIGIWLGWELLPLVLLATTLLGLAAAGAARLLGKKQESALPFGSYLAVASLLLCWHGWLLGR